MPALLRRGIDQKICQRLQQQRPEPTAVRIGNLKKISFHDHDEKILRQILGVGPGITEAIDKGEDRAPVNLAKLRETGIDFARRPGASARANQAPTRRDKMR
jgi:hypothetical protein